MRRLLGATLLLYPRAVRRRHGAELASLVQDLIERDGRSRPAVLLRLAADGLTQRLASRATAWAVTVGVALASFGGLAVSDFAAASAHPRRVIGVEAHRAPGAGQRRAPSAHPHRGASVLHPHRTGRRSAGIIG